ncbi:rCG57746 [Rattus norvegicus]|uniref:RCG57746 n=1 Tax=Rattus norvegicus TaxID=10116 RepID=A6JHW6_RAT|nr:rCG57746 [Rattus norvegicus]
MGHAHIRTFLKKKQVLGGDHEGGNLRPRVQGASLVDLETAPNSVPLRCCFPLCTPQGVNRKWAQRGPG